MAKDEARKHDPRLIGHWLNSEARPRGAFADLIEISITFLSDGRALEFEGRTIAPAQNVTTYYWATDGGQLLFGQTPGTQTPVGTYTVQNDALTVTHLDGARAAWQRVG